MYQSLIPETPQATQTPSALAVRAAMRDSVVGHRVLMTAGLDIPAPVAGRRFPFGMTWQPSDAAPDAQAGGV
jgi:hypothetical protein